MKDVEGGGMSGVGGGSLSPNLNAKRRGFLLWPISYSREQISHNLLCRKNKKVTLYNKVCAIKVMSGANSEQREIVGPDKGWRMRGVRGGKYP